MPDTKRSLLDDDLLEDHCTVVSHGGRWVDAVLREHLPEYLQAGSMPGEQPETQLGVDLIRAEAAIARVRALHEAEQRLGGPPRCGHDGFLPPCPTIRALDGES